MALAGALCHTVHTVTGFTNHSLRGLVAGRLDADYTSNQMSYDLRRLRLHGLVERIPHANRYRLTPDGLRVAIFYTQTPTPPPRPPPRGRQTAGPYRNTPSPHPNRENHNPIHDRRQNRNSGLKLVTKFNISTPKQS